MLRRAREALLHLKQADALLVPGSDDPAYTASKIYPYLLARRPMLAVFHEASGVIPLLRKVGGAVCVSFATEETEAQLAEAIAEAWLNRGDYLRIRPLDEAAFHPHTDAGSARSLAAFFRACVGAEHV
ncbi:MAG: hypothetical protein IPL96_02875 [Holophagaceae bacterium]|nr:hypothetical protein [Holophagaceae bacterium]